MPTADPEDCASSACSMPVGALPRSNFGGGTEFGEDWSIVSVCEPCEEAGAAADVSGLEARMKIVYPITGLRDG